MHQEYFRQALILAKPYQGSVSPNPAVGALVVRDGQIVGLGAHQGPGQAHAEVVALEAAGQRARGARMYVTLEPCSHTGRTGPCTQALHAAGISEVIYGFADSNPTVSGRGADVLRNAGIACRQVCLPEINAFYQQYDFSCKRQRPWLSAKLALSLDNKTAAAGGKRAQITGEKAQAFTHQMRAQHDVILTTDKTIAADDPLLNVRLEGQRPQAKPVVILAREGYIAPNARILNSANRVIIFHDTPVSCPLAQVEYLQVSQSPEAVIKQLYALGFISIWLEAGATCFEAYFKAGIMNTAYYLLALNTLGENGHVGLKEALALLQRTSSYRVDTLGDDIRITLNWEL